MSDLHFLSLTALATRIRSKDVSPTEITRLTLERIERLNPALRHYICLTPQRALAQARDAERLLLAGEYRGALHGVPIAVKDNIATAGVLTTAGSRALAGWIPTRSADVMRALSLSGAVMLGKLNMSEFAARRYLPNYGEPTNPWNVANSCGFSSGGSAGSLAAGLAFATLGTDTGGSIRIPASVCGVTGLKPSIGLVSRAGVISVSRTLDHVGPLARNAADVESVLAALNRTRPTAHPHGSSALKGLRLGAILDRGATDAKVWTAYQEALNDFEGLGASIDGFELPGEERTRRTVQVISTVERARYHAANPRLGLQNAAYSRAIRERLQAAHELSDADYRKALASQREITRELNTAMQRFDILVMPTLPLLPWPLSADRDNPSDENDLMSSVIHYLGVFNLTGQPAITMPCGFASGLPIGLQVAGKRGSDWRLLKIASAYQETTNWHLRHPSI